jgi:metallo-beta-lactamase class B
VEGQPITLGDTKIAPILIPGHTPGSLALIFPVFDKGKKYTAGIFGGTVLSAGFVSTEGLRQYIDSVQRYARIAAEKHVDVEIQNHPLMDGFTARLEQLKKRTPQATHPFVIGEAAYAAFLGVMSECSQAQLLRKAK